MPYRLSRQADEDYYAIFQYGKENFGLAQAEKYADRLDLAFEFLADHPNAARERAEVHPPIRAHPVGVHLIVYQIQDDGGILVIRVAHGREDWIRR